MSLFTPRTTDDLRKQYPELGRIPEFDVLRPDEVLFGWWYCCVSSPFVQANMTEEKRRAESIKKAFGSNCPPKIKEQYVTANFSERALAGFERWRNFEIEYRKKAKALIDHAFNNLTEMLDVKKSDFIEYAENGKEKVDWAAKKAYVDTITKVSDLLPKIIQQAEEGFGIAKEEKAKEEKSVLNQYLDEKS